MSWFKDFHLKLKAFRLRKFWTGSSNDDRRKYVTVNQPSWETPISHGHCVLQNVSTGSLSEEDDHSVPDVVVAQAEQIQDIGLWFFGVFDSRIAERVTKHMQSCLFDKMPKEIGRKSKNAPRKAHLAAGTSIMEEEGVEDVENVASASAMIINGEKLVVANMGGFRAVLCKYGVAQEVRKNERIAQRHWSFRLISATEGILACDSTGSAEIIRPSELLVGAAKLDWGTEFVILASNGIWEVMNNQETVNLIRHMKDAQEAAECLAKEAFVRMTKSNISCLVIRFN